MKISGYWIMNLSTPNNVSDIYSTWEKYEYTDIEKKILKDINCIKEGSEFSFSHILYNLIKRGREFQETKNLEELIPYALKKYDLTNKEIVEYLLSMVDTVCSGRNFTTFQTRLFSELKKNKDYEEVSEITYTHRAYNEYLAQNS